MNLRMIEFINVTIPILLCCIVCFDFWLFLLEHLLKNFIARVTRFSSRAAVVYILACLVSYTQKAREYFVNILKQVAYQQLDTLYKMSIGVEIKSNEDESPSEEEDEEIFIFTPEY